MSWYLAHLCKRYPCGSFKDMRYYLRASRRTEALRRVRSIYPSWELLSLRCLRLPEEATRGAANHS